MLNTEASQSVLNGGNEYRLKQPLGSSGDIWEIDAGASCVYVGPDSDLAEYRLLYYDPSSPNELAAADVSVGGPFVGQLNSQLSRRLRLTREPGRILAHPVDLYEPDYERPTGGSPDRPSRTIRIPPVVDLMFAFTPRTPPAVRSDRTVRLTEVPFEDDGVGTDILIPAYGRRLITVQALSYDDVELNFYKVVFQYGASNDFVRPELIQEPVFTGGLSIPILRTKVIRASNDQSGTTDNLGGAWENQPTPGPIGAFDYFVINIQRGFVGTGPGHCKLLYVKLSDREA